MDKNNYYFYVSALISFSLFFLFFVLFAYMLFSSSKSKSFSLNKDNYISVSIDMNFKKITKKKVDITQPNIIQAKDSNSKEVDIDDLFSDVWTKDISKKSKPKIVDNKRLQQIQKRIKTSKENNVKKISPVLKNIDAYEFNNENNANSSGDEVNEYLAKIQALVYQYFYPPQNSQGHSVKAVIELGSLGKVLDFRILNYSSNELLNIESDKIKSRLISVVFPINPENKSGKYIIILTSKE